MRTIPPEGILPEREKELSTLLDTVAARTSRMPGSIVSTASSRHTEE